MKWVGAILILWLLANPNLCIAQQDTSPSSTEPADPFDNAGATSQPARITSFTLDARQTNAHLADLLHAHVAVFTQPAVPLTPAELRLLQFSVRKEIADIVATEGYFAPTIQFASQASGDNVAVTVTVGPGKPSRVSSVQITFAGTAVPASLQQSIREAWALPVGAVFRDDDWTRAKNQALDGLASNSFAAAKISASQAEVQDQAVALSIELESGAPFVFGPLQIEGLRKYQPWLIDRYHPPVEGEPYSRDTLLKFQRDLQNSPYFASVTVSVDPDPAHAAAVPVRVQLTERKKYDAGFGAGYSTNTRARGEVSLQDRDFLGDAFDLKSVIRIEQLRQIGYVDLYLPPQESGYMDSVGVLFDRTDISGLVTSTSSLGVKRTATENDIERRFGLAFVYEESTVLGGSESLAKALVPSIGWTRRRVNNLFDPRDGYVAQLDVSGAAKAVLSDQNFVRVYGKYQHWFSVTESDVLILRAELGQVFAPSRDGIPEDYLFRAGGTGSVRGYGYQSLGISQDDGIVGGRVLATASAEYVHWLSATWGVAAFVDEGDAADTWNSLRMQQGIGAGLRFKTPAGPIALDVGYAREVRQFRLDFSIGIAF